MIPAGQGGQGYKDPTKGADVRVFDGSICHGFTAMGHGWWSVYLSHKSLN